MNKEFFEYVVTKLIKVVDGDTLYLEVDQGLYNKTRVDLRLMNVDTPEIRTTNEEEKKLGYHFKEYVANIMSYHMSNQNEIIVRTYKKGKYGRWIGNLYFDDDTNLVDLIYDEMERQGIVK